MEPSSEELRAHTHTRFFSYINSKWIKPNNILFILFSVTVLEADLKSAFNLVQYIWQLLWISFFSLLSLWLLKNIVVFSANNLGLLFPHIFPYIDGEERKWVSAGVKSWGLIWLKHRYIFSLPCYEFLFHSYLKLFANFDSIYKCPAFWLWGYLFV